VVNSVKEMEFDPLKSNFVLALQVIGKMNMKSWESSFKVLERCGWSRHICLLAFQKYPQCMNDIREKGYENNEVLGE
ncbi:hypothetical protein RYX36_016650, partial [Vicia faba]